MHTYYTIPYHTRVNMHIMHIEPVCSRHDDVRAPRGQLREAAPAPTRSARVSRLCRDCRRDLVPAALLAPWRASLALTVRYCRGAALYCKYSCHASLGDCSRSLWHHEPTQHSLAVLELQRRVKGKLGGQPIPSMRNGSRSPSV